MSAYYYNNTYHSGIKMETWTRDSEKLLVENSEAGKYARRFKKGYRENFTIRKEVLVAQHENLKSNSEEIKERFLKGGIIINKFENESS